MDITARSLKDKGECFYTIGSSGHEGNAVFGKVFPYKDIAFLHYRSAPFFLERSKQLAHSTPIYDMALSFVASSDDPISGGRHKVIGSHELNIPPQTSTIASHIPKAVGTAFSIDRARDLNILERSLIDDSIVESIEYIGLELNIDKFDNVLENEIGILDGYEYINYKKS